MGINDQMNPLDFLTNEELLRFFHGKKTEMSCMEQPHTFLNQLRDHNLVEEKLYMKVSRMRSKEQKEKGVYWVLDCLETERPDCITRFWDCVFKDHILQQYPTLRLLRNSLMDGSFTSCEKLPEVEEQSNDSEGSNEEGKGKEKKKGKKRKESKTSEEEEQPGPSSQSTPSQKKKAKKLTYSSPLRKGQKEDIWNWAFYKTTLPVTCGDKEGTLHREKLARGEKCIVVRGHWFSLTAFEEFGGKKRCKSWKTSIRCRNTTLHKLIQEGHLHPPKMKRRRTLREQDSGPRSSPVVKKLTQSKMKSKRVLFPSSASHSSVTQSDSESEEMDEERSEEGVEERRGEEAGEEDEEEEDREEDGEEEAPAAEGGRTEGGSHDDVDMSVFEGPSLSVTCGSATGTLLKKRFASGTLGPCVRTEERWMTPAEFVCEEPTLRDSNWRRDILCNGKPLSFLLIEKVLRLHRLCCLCKLCRPQEQDLSELKNDDDCFICGSDDDILLCCDECPRTFHHTCHLPTVDGRMLGDQWLCTYCVLKKSLSWQYSNTMTQQQALHSSINAFKLHCQYLLLCLHKEDVQRVFRSDPCLTVTGYAGIINKPMWLDKVVSNLQSNEYKSVEQFVSDVQLIFHNCATFNKDNEFGRLGARLKDLFEREFQRIFSIQ